MNRPMEPNSASEDRGSLQRWCSEVVEGEILKSKQNRANRCVYIYIYINRSLSPLSFHSIFLNTSLSLSLINSKSPITQTIARIYQDIKKTTIYGRQSNEIYHCFFNPFKSLIFSPMVSYSSIFGQVSNLV